MQERTIERPTQAQFPPYVMAGCIRIDDGIVWRDNRALRLPPASAPRAGTPAACRFGDQVAAVRDVRAECGLVGRDVVSTEQLAISSSATYTLSVFSIHMAWAPSESISIA